MHLYERSAILNWLQQGHNTSPMNNLPLQVNQLVAKPATQALINNRLTFHSNRLRALAAAAVGHIPTNGALQAAADAETPNLG